MDRRRDGQAEGTMNGYGGKEKETMFWGRRRLYDNTPAPAVAAARLRHCCWKYRRNMLRANRSPRGLSITTSWHSAQNFWICTRRSELKRDPPSLHAMSFLLPSVRSVGRCFSISDEGVRTPTIPRAKDIEEYWRRISFKVVSNSLASNFDGRARTVY